MHLLPSHVLLDQGLLCGPSRLLHLQLLLAQHFLALEAGSLLRFSQVTDADIKIRHQVLNLNRTFASHGSNKQVADAFPVHPFFADRRRSSTGAVGCCSPSHLTGSKVTAMSGAGGAQCKRAQPETGEQHSLYAKTH